MGFDETALADQLQGLRKGRGLLSANIADRLGSELIEVCGIGRRDGAGTIREKIKNRLQEFLEDVPLGPRRAVLVALAIDPEAQFPTVTGRRDWLASIMPCDVRTVRRLEDRGFAAIVHAALARTNMPSPALTGSSYGWRLRRFRALLRLDKAPTELVEERTIVATRDGLSEIVAAISLPKLAGGGSEPGVTAEVLYGARIASVSHTSAQHFRFVLELPRPLRLGEEHEYGICFRLADGQPMRPHYAFQPLLPCESFDLRVRFNPQQPPHAIWRLDDAPPRVVEDGEPTNDLLHVDAVGDIRLGFTELAPGLGYGLAWSLD